MSTFKGGFTTYAQLPPIDGVNVFIGDMAYTLDDGGFWSAQQPTTPPGALAQWAWIDQMRGGPGPQGPPGVGLPGPNGQIGPPGMRGGQGPQGPPGKNLFSYLGAPFSVPACGAPQVLAPVTDSSWMQPGQLVYIPGAGTFTCIGNPPDPGHVNLVSSCDPNNAAAGTIISPGVMISPANMRGPTGPVGSPGPVGPPGPQGVGGVSVFSTLRLDFTVPVTTGIAFVVDATAFAPGQIVYMPTGNYFSVQAVDHTQNTLTVVNQNYPGEQPAGTIIPAASNVTATGPQGPMGVVGPIGPPGIQGPTGSMPTGIMLPYGAPTPPAGWLACNGQAVSRVTFSVLFSIISTNWGAGDGVSTFNVPDFRGRVPVGTGTSPVSGTVYALGATGGEEKHALLLAELAAHVHHLTDPGHVHPDPGHSHTGYTATHGHGASGSSPPHTHADTGHVHPFIGIGGNSLSPGSAFGSFAGIGTNTGTGYAQLQAVAVGVSVVIAAAAALAVQTYNSPAGLQPQVTGITNTDSVGSGTPHNNMQPYLGVPWIIKT